jgi:hypothetical protein
MSHRWLCSWCTYAQGFVLCDFKAQNVLVDSVTKIYHSDFNGVLRVGELVAGNGLHTFPYNISPEKVARPTDLCASPQVRHLPAVYWRPPCLPPGKPPACFVNGALLAWPQATYLPAM